jgi:hypothetical protein
MNKPLLTFLLGAFVLLLLLKLAYDEGVIAGKNIAAAQPNNNLLAALGLTTSGNTHVPNGGGSDPLFATSFNQFLLKNFNIKIS